MINRMRARLGRFLLLGILGSVLSAPLWGQCAMCKASAQYQRGETINAINKGIIVLGIPPLAIAVGIVCLTYRYRNGPVSPDPPTTPDISA
jgi:membrane protein DedA with SNARE-associated domain